MTGWQCPKCLRWFAAAIRYEPTTDLCFDCWRAERGKPMTSYLPKVM